MPCSGPPAFVLMPATHPLREAPGFRARHRYRTDIGHHPHLTTVRPCSHQQPERLTVRGAENDRCPGEHGIDGRSIRLDGLVVFPRPGCLQGKRFPRLPRPQIRPTRRQPPSGWRPPSSAGPRLLPLLISAMKVRYGSGIATRFSLSHLATPSQPSAGSRHSGANTERKKSSVASSGQ